MKTRYDYTKLTEFLNEYDLADLYTEVCEAMHLLSTPKKHITKDDIQEIWLTLLTCADMLNTIEIKRE